MKVYVESTTNLSKKLDLAGLTQQRLEYGQEIKVKKRAVLFTFGLLLLFGNAAHSTAQVKRVQMHIAGYLCGN